MVEKFEKALREYKNWKLQTVEISKERKSLVSLLDEMQTPGAPSPLLCAYHGMKDLSYSTVRYGFIPSYRGRVYITKPDGVWRCTGIREKGDVHLLYKRGGIVCENTFSGEKVTWR